MNRHGGKHAIATVVTGAPSEEGVASKGAANVGGNAWPGSGIRAIPIGCGFRSTRLHVFCVPRVGGSPGTEASHRTHRAQTPGAAFAAKIGGEF